MILPAIIAVLFSGGILAWIFDRIFVRSGCWIALVSILISGILLANYSEYFNWFRQVSNDGNEIWWDSVKWMWIPRFGISFFIAIDGLSFIMLMLTLSMGLFGLIVTWGQIKFREGFFYFNYLWTLAGIVGVFTAMDLFLFFFFWEVMLIPMLLLIAIWGYEKRIFAAIKFFIFTQSSSLAMLAAIIALSFINYKVTGKVTFNYLELINTPMSLAVQYWLMLGFFIAFVVKLPAVPVHPWLPDAHTQAPTAGSILLAAVLLKTGAYGLLRFTLPLFPQASIDFAPFAMAIGALSIVYGALMAFSQQDMKRLVAYSSISHMGFVLLGIYALNSIALQGAIMQMVAHGLSTAALFALVGAIQQRLHTRDMRKMGGLWKPLPKLAAMALLFSVASLGLPGLGNFVGEFLVLLGSFSVNAWLTAIAALGLIGAAVYALTMIQKTFFGSYKINDNIAVITDATVREFFALLVLVIGLVWLGLSPQPVFDLTNPGFERLLEQVQPLRAEQLNPVSMNINK